ncbi:MAG: hypothetical protein JNK14_09420 [Chitinophagaceae bacterium]|nr:hypothetical protein [Chitinophagaceae bacterium]
MPIIVNIKTKTQEKKVCDFLKQHAIDFQTIVEEEQAPYRTGTKKTLTAKEKKILKGLDQSVDFVNKYKKGKTKTKSLNQLLNEL